MFRKFDVSMLVMGMPFDGDTLETRSLGGSESAALYLAKALAREGARVVVFCNTPDQSVDEVGVQYAPASAWPRYTHTTPHDVCIVQRAPEAFSQRTAARLNLLWCHDLALGRNDKSFRSALWNVDRVIVLSEFMRRQYQEVHGLDDETFFVSRNGVDLTLFDALRGERREGFRRDRKKLIYAARPERGLDLLLRDVMPRLLARDPSYQLYVAGYDNPTEEWRAFYAGCDRLAAQLGDRVVKLGALTKRELYRQYLSAGLYVYPTPSAALPNFREVSCISAMECQAAGLPIVTSAMGALPETIAPGAGILLAGDPSAEASRASYAKEFAQATVNLTADEAAWTAASSTGLVHARNLDWSAVAREWLGEFERLIRAANDSPTRLVRHFWRTSDIVAAKRVLGDATDAQVPADERTALTELLAPWSFMDEPEGYRKQYERIGVTHDPAVYESAVSEPRFELLRQWLIERTSTITTVLDYGCAHGAYAIGLAEHISDLHVQGVDIDRHSVDMARARSAQLNLTDRAQFSVWTHDHPEPLSGDRPFDCALIQEVLEHVPEPWEVIERIERLVRVGGKVYITVPFGPWEFESYRSYPHRCHIWHFDAHDLSDMIGDKQDLEIEASYSHDSPLTSDPQGWWIATYTADHRPIGQVDVERHAWLQRPRQSVSTAIIAGPGCEETLHWTLRSIETVSDEIVVTDCGMNAEARRIAGQYAVRLLEGINPAVEGFDRARNIALEACICDWCLWIDTDEKLVGSAALDKYLRDNAYHAYGVRQHHFACDLEVPPDAPARLFRRRPYRGNTLRFYGAIHEHPELELNAGAGPTIALCDVHLAHVGYLNEGARRNRFVRNLPLLALDQQRYPDRLLQKHFLIRDTLHLIRYALEQNGGVVTDDICAKCRNAVELYRKHFLGKTYACSDDTLHYYSEALAILGEGFEAAFQVETDKTEAKPNGVQRFRFASAEDLTIELNRRARERAAKFDSVWW